MSAQRFGDRWEIVGQIGEGGQSHVFLVKDLRGEITENCVLKRLKNVNRLDRFEQEIKAGIELSHPQIAPILDFSLDQKPYFVTKCYPGPTLTALAPLDPLQALKIFIEICDAVAYAHEQGIVHRDLNPDNIILDTYQKPVILDFGICYFVDEDNRLTETMEQVGSRYYIAPELEDGRSTQVTETIDSYSLGKILHFLISATVFARENYTGSNDLSKLCQNPQLDYISQRVLAKSVVSESDQRSRVEELKEEAKTISRLINEHFYPGKVGSRCRFCGEGSYKAMSFAGLKAFTRVQSSPTASHAEEFFMGCESIMCDLCGNIQWFKSD